MAKIFDGVYYDNVVTTQNDKSDDKVTADCTECGKTISGNEASTGNFKSHYKLKHSTKYKQLEDYLKSNQANKKVDKQPKITMAVQNVSNDMVSI